MRFPKTIHLGLPLIIFIVLLFLVLTNVFYVNEYSSTLDADRIFYLIIHISFWLTTAFLFNTIVHKFFWGGVSKIPVGNYFFQKIKDFLSVLSYVIVICVIAVIYFGYDFDYNLISVGIIAALFGMVVRPYLHSFFRTVFYSNTSAFNIGDWLRLSPINSGKEIIGEVDDIDRRSLRLKTEDNNIVTVSQNSLNEFIIENFWGSGKESRFEINLILDYSVPVKRVKRILNAAAKQAIEEYELLKSPPPEVSIKNITHAGIEYAIYFWVIPWDEISPRTAKDNIITVVMEHLGRSGLSLAYPKEDIYITRMPERQTKISLQGDIKKIISSIELFDSLNGDELNEIAGKIIHREFDTNDTVIRQGDDGDSMFIVIEGLLDVFVDSSDGKQLRVGRLTPGDFFGEMSLMTGEKRSATVAAATEVLLFEITKESITDIVNNRESVINEFGEIISRRIELNLQTQKDYEKSKHNFFNEIVGKIKKFFQKK